MRQSYTVESLHCEDFRRSLINANIKFDEDKFPLNSFFTVDTDLNIHNKIISWVDAIKYSNETTTKTYTLWNGGECNEFIDFVNKVVSNSNVTVTKGWFKTRIEVYAHQSVHEKFLNFIKNI